MSDHRSLPLRDLAVQGRFGTSVGEPGVTLSIQHPLSLVQILARKAGMKSLKASLSTLKDAVVMSAGPDQYYVQATGLAEGMLYANLKKKLEGKASVVDQSHARVAILLSGPQSRAVLAKGTPVDFDARQFAIGQSAQTQMAHVGVHITRMSENGFSISVFRGFSEGLWEWLTVAAAEFGYQVN